MLKTTTELGPRLRLVPRPMSISDEGAVEECAFCVCQALRFIGCHGYYHAGIYAERARVKARKIHDPRVKNRAHQLCDALDRLGCTVDFALVSDLEVRRG